MNRLERVVSTAGERVAVTCASSRWAALIDEAFGKPRAAADRAPTLNIRVEPATGPFDIAGWTPLARGAWTRDGDVIVRDVCSSGFELLVRPSTDPCSFTFRWRPPARSRAASMVLRTRFRLLARAVLLQFPVLWWAGIRRRAPLHAPVVTSGSITALLAGPGGIGKSTLIARELEAGGQAASDNISIGDGATVWGLVEPMRIERPTGRRMPHGRREAELSARVPELTPTHLLVFRRTSDERATARRCDPQEAARALISGTYMAGELRRFWGFAATLAAGTGLGPAHPPVSSVAEGFASRLPSVEVFVPKQTGTRLADLLGASEVIWA